MIELQEYTRETESLRATIQSLCYRMTGSYHDSEDLTQECFLTGWRRIADFRGDSSLKTWLYRIAIHLCLSFLRNQKRRSLPGAKVGQRYRNGETLPQPVEEAVWLEPYPTPEDRSMRRQTLSLAFLTLLQALPVRQRAVFILTNVLDYSAKETAELLDCSVVSVNSALQRARKTLGAFSPKDSVAESDVAEVLEKYVTAWEAGDAEAIVALVRSDATMVMPPYPVWVDGPADILRVLLDYPMSSGQRWKLVPTSRANGDFAFGFYKKVSPTSWQGWGVQVLSLEKSPEGSFPIVRIYVFKGERLLPVFGLEKEIEFDDRSVE